MDKKEKVHFLVEEIVSRNQLSLVEYKLSFHSKTYMVKCLVDYPQGGINLQECAKVNREIFSCIEQTGLLGEDFAVEVNSPGLDRKLEKYEDFLRIKGKEASVWLKRNLEGKRNCVEGVLSEVNKDSIKITNRKESVLILLSEIKYGKEKIGGVSK